MGWDGVNRRMDEQGYRRKMFEVCKPLVLIQMIPQPLHQFNVALPQFFFGCC